MSSINSVALSGNLVDDAVLRSTKSGTAVLNFTVAVTERVKGADGAFEDRPSYIDCAVFGRRADALSRYLAKGSLAMVQGHLRQIVYNDRQGQRRSKVEVMADEIEWRTKRSGEVPAETPVAFRTAAGRGGAE
ncbi:single-stranded DNA-binding protein [Thermophilibacter provencensis]|uniref:Single-stranded DNA-binding protein n=1 Tax=Thermophilibacter provencensis TaxID=1852386 RepID=A0A921GGV1_9ACTN|nr:single-stranded DNA-binding protein [Thermophilibacter provencensis]HJF45843.1 single-stranded DNA-binding protein [Thermophilibacter provencensis]